MASIENRSRIKVTVQNRNDLTKTFSWSDTLAIQSYIAELKQKKFKPRATCLNDSFAVRIRQKGYPEQCIFVSSESEAVELQQQIARERKRGVFTDYMTAWQTSLADLLIRYLRDESPRNKSFEIEGYKINAMLEDAGLERQDLAEILKNHKNPHPKWIGKAMRKPTGQRMSTPSGATHFIRKSFAAIKPEDFKDYVDERCQVVADATVDRELDIFAAVCNIAVNTWRIPVAKNPIDGVRRPKYFNERDRRLKSDEESRLLLAARYEDRERSIGLHLEILMEMERVEANSAITKYQRKNIVKAARAKYLDEAERSYTHIGLLEAFVQFQLMTAARRGETLALTWANLDLESQTAYLLETKNGRARKLPLRSDLINLLRQLPRDSELVFPIGVDGLRNAWSRMCAKAGLVGNNELHIHDLRHEGISRVAEAGSRTPGGFSLVDLQAFSGHRDTRMLLRYAHLCTQSLAKRLDAAFASETETTVHHGMRRLRKGSSVTLGEVVAAQSAGIGTPQSNQLKQLSQQQSVKLCWKGFIVA
ncbi:MAG: site-specific integrase [Formivibrio sp.]|nr:site-specific integrase [Formivibrio sp.]